MNPLSLLTATPLFFLLTLTLAAETPAKVGDDEIAPGFKIHKLNEVTCEEPTRKGDMVSLHYRGTLSNGTVFDSSYGRGIPVQLPLGKGKIVKGLEVGLMDMCVGEKRRLEIPAAMAYGEKGKGPVPGGENIEFEVKVVGIQGRGKSAAGVPKRVEGQEKLADKTEELAEELEQAEKVVKSESREEL